MNLVTKKPDGRFVFVGDTHGDLGASKYVFNKYSDSETNIVFLGDYVDRGVNSRGNIDFLLNEKIKRPDKVCLLQGNHENYDICKFHPADFWESLNKKDFEYYNSQMNEFPLVFSAGDVVALHGALPNINKIREVNNICALDENWKNILRGDFLKNEDDGMYASEERPYFGQRYFEDVMGRLNKNVLIRGHQAEADLVMFDNRCLTIFTSCYYPCSRAIAIVDFSRKKKIRDIDDLEIEIF
jgi:predicted phosphodiesterase